MAATTENLPQLKSATDGLTEMRFAFFFSFLVSFLPKSVGSSFLDLNIRDYFDWSAYFSLVSVRTRRADSSTSCHATWGSSLSLSILVSYMWMCSSVYIDRFVFDFLLNFVMIKQYRVLSQLFGYSWFSVISGFTFNLHD